MSQNAEVNSQLCQSPLTDIVGLNYTTCDFSGYLLLHTASC